MIDKEKIELLIKLSPHTSAFLKASANVRDGKFYTIPVTYEVIEEREGCLYVKEHLSFHAKEVAIDFAMWICNNEWQPDDYPISRVWKKFNKADGGYLKLKSEDLFQEYLQQVK